MRKGLYAHCQLIQQHSAFCFPFCGFGFVCVAGRGYFWVFDSIPLNNLSVSVPMPWVGLFVCFYHCRFIINWRTGMLIPWIHLEGGTKSPWEAEGGKNLGGWGNGGGKWRGIGGQDLKSRETKVRPRGQEKWMGICSCQKLEIGAISRKSQRPDMGKDPWSQFRWP